MAISSSLWDVDSNPAATKPAKIGAASGSARFTGMFPPVAIKSTATVAAACTGCAGLFDTSTIGRHNKRFTKYRYGMYPLISCVLIFPSALILDAISLSLPDSINGAKPRLSGSVSRYVFKFILKSSLVIWASPVLQQYPQAMGCSAYPLEQSIRKPYRLCCYTSCKFSLRYRWVI